MSTPYSLRLEISGLPKSANARLHWRARYAENQTWKGAVARCVRKQDLPKAPLERAHVRCTLHSSVPRDADNIVAGFKPIIDALVDIGILAGDKWSNIGMPEYRWERVPPKQGRVTVEVTEAQS